MKIDFEVPPDLSRELLRLANGSDLSLYIIFEAALKILQHDYTAATFKAHLLDVRKRVLLDYTFDPGLKFDINSEIRNLGFDRDGVVKTLVQILRSVVSNVDIPIDDLTLLPRGPERDIAGRLTHRLFEAQVEKTPHRIAVSSHDESLSYAELNARANRLARGLQRHGVTPEQIVPVLMRRSPNLLTAMLALFKCGGVYLPLDPHQPPARLAQIISDSGSSFVLATQAFRNVVEAPVLFFEDLLSESEQNLRNTIDPSNLAYVIYTSGSTGAPKGAMLEHRGMFNHLDAKVVDLELSETDVVAQTASQCFDVSVWQFLAALLTGARVRIIADEVVKEPSQLLKELTRESVSVLEVVPSQLRAMLQTMDFAPRSDLSSLRFLLVTGEALPPALCCQWLDNFPLTPLVNAYGPTECSDDVTHHFIRSAATNSESTPIGRPIQNTQVYVLNRDLRPVPIGVTGEIYVGGIGVGRGYVHDAKRTAEVYLPDLFSKQAGARLYYTGDLGCYLPDGNIQFNGRRDHQVKIRGFRIELGEIEAALRAHPEVQDAVVISSDTRLVAYIAHWAGAKATKKDLRQFLRGKLTEYMVPSEFVILDRLPLNRNGKVDRNALPLPVRDEDEDFVPPSTEIEKTLASIWARNLKVNDVSLSDNFFDLGGNSLLSIQVLNQIRYELSVDLPMKALLGSATLAELAEITNRCQNNATAFATQR